MILQDVTQLRLTSIDDLRDTGAQNSSVKRIVGNENSSVTVGIYGSKTPLRAMAAALQHIT